MKHTKRQRLPERLFIFGLFFLGIVAVINAWTVPTVLKILSGQDVILSKITIIRSYIINVCLVVIGITLVLVKYRANIWIKKILDALIGISITIGLLFLIEGYFYFLNARHDSANDDVVRNIEFLQMYQYDQLLGYKPKPNQKIPAIKLVNGETAYNVVYSIDEYSRRITPIESPDRSKFILFFGGSFTFGEGVEDNETLPFYVGQLAPDYKPYNYGVGGYGPQQMLAKLQDDNITSEISETDGMLVYTFIGAHVPRAIGSMSTQNHWGKNMPFYAVDSENNLIRRGDFITGRPLTSAVYYLLGSSQLVSYFNIELPSLGDKHYRLTARIIAESRNIFKEEFNSDQFYMLIYPDGASGKIVPYLDEVGVKYLDYSTLTEIDQLRLSGDPHPAPRAYQMAAEKLVIDIDITDVVQ